MCVVNNADDSSANRDNTGNGGNGTDPPNSGNGGNRANGGNGGDRTNANNGGAVEPPTIINEQTGECVMIKLNEQEWARCREALRGTPLPFGSLQKLLMGYHWLLKEEFKRQLQTIAQLEARKKAADESSLGRAGLSSYRGSSSKGNEQLAKKRQSWMAHLTEQECIEAAKVLDFGSMTVDTRGNMVPRTRQAAVTAATIYLLNNQQPAGDPRTAMHRSTITGLGLIEAALDKEPVPDPK